MNAPFGNWSARPETPRPLRVCALYEGIRDWRRVGRLLDRLREATDTAMEVAWFEFDELPMFFDRACRDAASADLVLVAGSKRRPVPRPVHRWLMAVRDRRALQPAALIGLFSESDPNRAVCPWERLLQDVAIASGRDLFIRSMDARAFHPRMTGSEAASSDNAGPAR